MDVAEPAPAEGNTTAMEEDRSASVPLGYYDCVGVVTHKGRALSSGHYQGFVKNEKGSEGEWLQYDDDEVIPRTEADIKNLHGGGDWDTAYLVIYKTRFSLP
eukprot:TRINITY_DN17278_c0_g1_i4.p1 TRINITY_DN17278_c0_g1~~TRINITY_DN17278_c0_g1_i4.p1  ORF type:complete len:102 (-),score=9.63 TRINITY_DN17278_c0_g1_i4:161-466(-)